MTLTLACASTDNGFTTADFYVAAATLIPVLFLALAVEGSFITALLKASKWAEDAWGSLLLLAVFGPLYRAWKRRDETPTETPPERKTGRLVNLLHGRGGQIVLWGGLFLAFTPALLAMCIIVFSTASEVVAILVLYHQDAASWTGPFVITGAISLIIMVAITPAIAIVLAIVKGIRDI